MVLERNIRMNDFQAVEREKIGWTTPYRCRGDELDKLIPFYSNAQFMPLRRDVIWAVSVLPRLQSSAYIILEMQYFTNAIKWI